MQQGQCQNIKRGGTTLRVSTDGDDVNQPKSSNKAQTPPRKTKRTKLEISTSSSTKSKSKQNNLQSKDDIGDDADMNYAYHIPKTGYSLADQLEKKGPDGAERFITTLTPIIGIIGNEKGDAVHDFVYDEDGFPIGFKEVDTEHGGKQRRHEGVARIDTISTLGNAGEEPVRWLVSMGSNDVEKESFVMIDLPPYSDRLANEIREFMDPTYNTTDAKMESNTSSPSLDAILLTNQQCIYYDNSPGVYVTRKSDLTKWKKAFPSAQVAMYRLDIPRECREGVDFVLDGYGPWGWSEHGEEGKAKFVETGRPLTIEEWDDDTKAKVLDQGEMPPDEQDGDEEDDIVSADEDDAMYSKEAIRRREEKHRLLAVYTPGHTFGSITYIFPKRGICCSGYALPLESPSATLDSAYDEDDDDDNSFTRSSTPIQPQGPRLDYQGYLATSASRSRQMSSALSFINNYIDRFQVVLPARGDVVFLDSNEEVRKRELMESVGLYRKIGEIYGRLGIVE